MQELDSKVSSHSEHVNNFSELLSHVPVLSVCLHTYLIVLLETFCGVIIFKSSFILKF